MFNILNEDNKDAIEEFLGLFDLIPIYTKEKDKISCVSNKDKSITYDYSENDNCYVSSKDSSDKIRIYDSGNNTVIEIKKEEKTTFKLDYDYDYYFLNSEDGKYTKIDTSRTYKLVTVAKEPKISHREPVFRYNAKGKYIFEIYYSYDGKEEVYNSTQIRGTTNEIEFIKVNEDGSKEIETIPVEESEAITEMIGLMIERHYEKCYPDRLLIIKKYILNRIKSVYEDVKNNPDKFIKRQERIKEKADEEFKKAQEEYIKVTSQVAVESAHLRKLMSKKYQQKGGNNND